MESTQKEKTTDTQKDSKKKTETTQAQTETDRVKESIYTPEINKIDTEDTEHIEDKITKKENQEKDKKTEKDEKTETQPTRYIEEKMQSRDPNIRRPFESHEEPFRRGEPLPKRNRPIIPQQKPSRRFRSPVSIQTIAVILTILLFGTNLIFLLKEKLGGIGTTSERYYKNHFQELAAEYGLITPDKCKQGTYYGLNDQFNGYIQTIIPYLSGDADAIERAIELQNETLKKNLIIYGMPGTGKSFFISKLFLQAALNIKGQQLLEKLKTSKLYLTEGEGIEELIKELYDCNDVVEMYQLNPSMFLNSLVGDSEKSLQRFLKFIDWRQKIVPVFIFLDEADALLGARRVSKGGGDQVSNNLKNAWLTWLDGIDTKGHKRVFVTAATNYYDRIDGAIRRRFSTYLGIPILTEKERKDILEDLFYKTAVIEDIQEEDKMKIVEGTEGFTINKMMHLKTDMENIKKTTKRPVQAKHLYKAIATAKVLIDEEKKKKEQERKQEEKYSIAAESKMSDPVKIETNIIWNKYNTNVIVTKEQMMYIEQKLGNYAIENKKDDELVDKMFNEDEFEEDEEDESTANPPENSSTEYEQENEGWFSYIRNTLGGFINYMIT